MICIEFENSFKQSLTEYQKTDKDMSVFFMSNILFRNMTSLHKYLFQYYTIIRQIFRKVVFKIRKSKKNSNCFRFQKINYIA